MRYARKRREKDRLLTGARKKGKQVERIVQVLHPPRKYAPHQPRKNVQPPPQKNASPPHRMLREMELSLRKVIQALSEKLHQGCVKKCQNPQEVGPESLNMW